MYLGSRSDCTEIVGVVKNTVLWEITGDKGSIVYLPFEVVDRHADQHDGGPHGVAIRPVDSRDTAAPFWRYRPTFRGWTFVR